MFTTARGLAGGFCSRRPALQGAFLGPGGPRLVDLDIQGQAGGHRGSPWMDPGWILALGPEPPPPGRTPQALPSQGRDFCRRCPRWASGGSNRLSHPPEVIYYEVTRWGPGQ